MRYLFFVILCSLFSISLLGQAYNTAGGIRLGTDWGLTLRQRVYEQVTGELLIQSSFQREETAMTLLGIVHQPLVVRNLNLFVGGGIHKGWITAEPGADPAADPFGLDVIAGIELTIARINLSWDFKPALNIVGGEQTFYAQSGVSLRYILWKREKYDWEKSKNKRMRQRAQKR